MVVEKTYCYEVLKETEKATFIKIPYWEQTNDRVKKHKQLFYECWVPKSILNSDRMSAFILTEREKNRLKNAYQRKLPMPASWNTLGQYAPEKKSIVVEEIDYDKLDTLRKELMLKYDVEHYDKDFFISPSNSVTDEVTDLARSYRNPKITDPVIPKKKVTYYK